MKKTNSDNILAIVKAAISAAPYVGGPIASLIGDYIPSATQKEVETSINTVLTFLMLEHITIVINP